MALYAIKNAAGALAAFPAGALGDRLGHRSVLVGGYVLGVVTMAGFGALFLTETRSAVLLGELFALAGVYVAIEEALEPALTAHLVPDKAIRGTAMGVLATVNGLGDFVASVAFGELVYRFGPQLGFAVAAGVMSIGAVWLAIVRIAK